MFRAIAASYRDAYTGHNRDVWILSVASLINRSGTMVLPFLILFLTEERAFSAADAGKVLALYGIGGMLASYLGGWMGDRFGPGRVMQASLALTGIGFLVLGRLHDRTALVLTIAFVGVAGEMFRPANATALASASPPGGRAKAFALYRLAVNAGMTLGPAIGGFLALRDYDLLFIVDGVTCLLAALLLRLTFQDKARTAQASATDPVEPTAAAPAPALSVWRNVPLQLVLFLNFLMAVVVFQTQSTLPLELHDNQGFTEADIGLVFAINTIVIVLFEMVLVQAVSKYSPLKMVGLGSFLFCLGFGLLPFGSGFVYVAFTILVWTVGEMLAFPIVAAVIADMAGEANIGRAMGLFNLAFATAFVVAPLAGTWVYENFGSDVLWYGCGVLGVVTWVGYHALAGRRGEAPPVSGAEASV
jgi:MFS family permease